MSERYYASFIDAFKELVDPIGAPPEFSTWTALWMLGSAVERQVWVHTRRQKSFANMFVLLCAPPGFGKGLTIEPCRDIMYELGPNRIGASSMTSASLADMLHAGHRTVIDPKTQLSEDFYGVSVISPELQVLFPQYDPGMTSKLTDLWDGKRYSEERRHDKEKGSFALERTFVSMLGGTTPEQIFMTFPESAFRTGFFSRMMFVWGSPGLGGDFFGEDVDEKIIDKMKADLAEELKKIAAMNGPYVWTPEAKALVRKFDKENAPYGGHPVPKHPRLLHYSTRRTHHLAKMMMNKSLDRADKPYLIDDECYHWAYNLLIETESNIPRIFEEMETGGETQVVDDVHQKLLTIFRVGGEVPLSHEQVLRAFMSQLPAWKAERIIPVAVLGGWLRETKRSNSFTAPKQYIPAATRPTLRERKMK